MRLKLAPRFMLFAVLCVYLTIGGMWLRNALGFNTGQIVFTSRRDGTNEIYVMDSDGKNPIRLTDGRGGKRDPDWPPDGGKIAFSVDDVVDHVDVMDADGNNRVRLEVQAWEPSWSPDGGTIAFLSSRDGGNEIYLVGAGRPGPKRRIQRVTHDLAPKGNPSFSPDGRQIAYVVAEHQGPGQIYVVGADGRNGERLTHNEENNWGPAWSPDGRTIAYHINNGNVLDGHDLEPDISPVGLAVSPASKKTTIWGRIKLDFVHK